jgi:hypothetical protein
MVQSSYWDGVMPRQFDEKRSFHRMTLDCAMSFSVEGQSGSTAAQCKNLSASGLMFESFHPIPVGTRVRINITPKTSFVAPLNATAEILRMVHRGERNTYDVAARITQLK